jgi:Ser/Thr protein kinase RdoA (MazF antagonist)
MHHDALSRLVDVVGSDVTPKVLSSSSDGRVVAAFGDVVAKLGLPGEAERAVAIIVAIRDQLGDKSPLLMPRVLWVRDDVMAMERLAGESYRDLVNGAEPEAAMHSAGRALAALHAVRPPELRVCTAADHLADLIRPHPGDVAEALPELAQRVESLLARPPIDVDDSAMSAVHRDLHLGQLFGSGAGVAVIDWDLAAVGDAALDLGNLRAYLKTRSPATASQLWAPLVVGYDRPLPSQISAYEALMYLRMASKAFRLSGRGAMDQITTLLSAAEACR